MEQLDETIIDQIKTLTLAPNTEPASDPVPNLQKEISKIDKQISRLMDLYALGSMPIDTIEGKIKALTDKKRNLENEIERIENEPKLDSETVLSMSAVIDSATEQEKRAIIDALIDCIVVDGENIEIHWNF